MECCTDLILDLLITPALDGARLDQALHGLLPEYSRSQIQYWIKQGWVSGGGKILKSKNRVLAGQSVHLAAQIEPKVDTGLAEPIPLNILYEDEEIIIVNKPAGMVTHPGAGNYSNTLLNALLYRYPELSSVPRAGIVHRLDKDTSGIMVVARNLPAHNLLVTWMQERKIHREYLAIVHGSLISGGTINANIGRHRQRRTLMAVRPEGRVAITHYRIIQRFAFNTYLRVVLETGRTHQIRVHLSSRGFPLVGDQDYCHIQQVSTKLPGILKDTIEQFSRQALHAQKLSLPHPKTKQLVEWEAPPPADFNTLLTCLYKYDPAVHREMAADLV